MHLPIIGSSSTSPERSSSQPSVHRHLVCWMAFYITLVHRATIDTIHFRVHYAVDNDFLRYLFTILAFRLTVIIQSPRELIICTLCHSRLDLDHPSHPPALSLSVILHLDSPADWLRLCGRLQAPRGIQLRPGNGNALYMDHAGMAVRFILRVGAGGVAEKYCQCNASGAELGDGVK